jgi:hypothetical protein
VRGAHLHRVPEGLRAAGGAVGSRVTMSKGLEGHVLADLRCEVELVVAGRPDPRLVRHAALHEARPRVPPIVVVERVVVRVRQVAHEQNGVAAVLLVVRKRLVRVERLAKVACNIQFSSFGQHSGFNIGGAAELDWSLTHPVYARLPTN